jgi:hypothetical protein
MLKMKYAVWQSCVCYEKQHSLLYSVIKMHYFSHQPSAGVSLVIVGVMLYEGRGLMDGLKVEDGCGDGRGDGWGVRVGMEVVVEGLEVWEGLELGFEVGMAEGAEEGKGDGATLGDGDGCPPNNDRCCASCSSCSSNVDNKKWGFISWKLL